jgi:ketosteroid isomerase-like protein
MTPEQTAAFAREWIEAWNSHDLDRILSHYAGEVEFISPFAVALAGASDGMIHGSEALRAYFSRALDAYPDLHFEFRSAASGVNSLALHYRSVGGREATEVMELDADGKVRRVLAHYSS